MLGGYYHTVPSKIKAKIMTSFLADFKGLFSQKGLEITLTAECIGAEATKAEKRRPLWTKTFFQLQCPAQGCQTCFGLASQVHVLSMPMVQMVDNQPSNKIQQLTWSSDVLL